MKKAITLIVLCVLVFMSLNNISYAGIDVFNASKGDTNLNGELDTKDLRDILRAASGLHSFGNSSSYIYDMNSDGTVTSSDLRYALRVREGIDFHPDDVKEAERRIESISQHLSTEELDRLIKTVCKYGSRSIFFPESNEAAQKFIEKELKSYGYKVKKQPFTYAGCDTANIVTTLNAEEKHKEILVLSTHFDCWDGVHAAIDNASGVATLLHTAKILKESGIEFDKEIRRNEDELDELNADISQYISSILGSVPQTDADVVSGYFRIVGNIERIGDHATNFADYRKFFLNTNTVTHCTFFNFFTKRSFSVNNFPFTQSML